MTQRPVNPSPELLGKLRKFRFQIGEVPKCDSGSDQESSNQSESTINETSATLKRRVLQILSDSDDDNEKKSNDVTSKLGVVHTKNRISDDSDDEITVIKKYDGNAVNGQSNRNDNCDSYAETCDGDSTNDVPVFDIPTKEKHLEFLSDAFPSADKLVLQDTLVHSNWSVEAAMAKLCDEKFSAENRKIREGHTAGKNGNIRNYFSRKRKGGDADTSTYKKKVKRQSKRPSDDETDDSEGEFTAGGNLNESKVFDSEDSDQEVTDDLTGDRKDVIEFLSNATVHELKAMSSCSHKKAEAIIENRPFLGWKDLVEKFQNEKFLSPDLLNSAQELLRIRQDVQNLMKKSIKLATMVEQAVMTGAGTITEQPQLVSKNLSLASYQLVGLNWLLVMHQQQINCILADEMGLGKTVQVIAFLAYLKESGLRTNKDGPHLVVVPSSTIDNWGNEFEKWCPSLNVVLYYGHPDDRKALRIDWFRSGLDDIDVILTTYSTINSSPEEKKLFRVLHLHYLVLDEAHMLKNMTSIRYETLIRINAKHRILMTGTPIQNNLLELISLLIFVMPKMFAGKKEELKRLFSTYPKQTLAAENDDEKCPEFERRQVSQARRIMKPFMLRRLKSEVLNDLPKKSEIICKCPLACAQEVKYKQLINTFSAVAGKESGGSQFNGMSMLMELRKMANHPLLSRNYFTDEDVRKMSNYLSSDVLYKEENPNHIYEDLCLMSDFQLHQMAKEYKTISRFSVPPELVVESGKFQKLDELLPKMKADGHRLLIFSQFVIMLDIVEEYLKIRGYIYTRLDGSTPVTSRQELIDIYNTDSDIFVFLLSTRAGGMGINLTAADTVIIHDIDFNPYNDKQAEDRCHRVGQTRDVTVIRLISADTIEEGIYQIAQDKLSLGKEIGTAEDSESSETKNVASLLKQALGLDASRTALLDKTCL